MKKVVIIVLILLFLCCASVVALFAFRSSIPFLKDINLGGITNLSVNNSSVTNTPVDDKNFNTTINDTNVDVNNTDKTWPTDMPSNIPQFKYGNIKNVTKVSNTESKLWSINYENINSNAYEGFQNDLKANGFTDLNLINYMPEGWSINTIKDKTSILAIYSASEGAVSLTISVEQ